MSRYSLFCLLWFISTLSMANQADVYRLKKAYPDHIMTISGRTITWSDGSKMPIFSRIDHQSSNEKLNSPRLYDQLSGILYTPGIPNKVSAFVPNQDAGRIRYEPFFLKMYGQTEQEVTANLVTIDWMPAVFGHLYPLKVTKINQVDKKLTQVSHELEKLVKQHPEYIPFLANPDGTFNWRNINHTHRLSMHSFGMTIDINSKFSNYWQWTLRANGLPISEDTPLIYQNNIPWEIIPIFEKYGFIWGGKWIHYDTMHFEYRPELLTGLTQNAVDVIRRFA